jgi:hypothetical protein
MSSMERAVEASEHGWRQAPALSGGAVETLDLGEEIAGAVLNVVRTVTERRGAALEIAEPEPVLRGVISAFAAISQTLPDGLDEAWALLGLLALELEDADTRS